MDHITSYPLCWPDGWCRLGCEESSRFGKFNKPVSIAKATEFVLAELKRKGIPDYNVIISADLRLRNDGLPYSTQREPEDKGCSVWWREGDTRKVIAIDKYNRVADNLYSIGKTIEALRGIARWGSGEVLERTFSGFDALPPAGSVMTGEEPWYVVLDIDPEHRDMPELIEQVYKSLRSDAHPDNGGSNEQFNRVQKAWETYQQLNQ